MTSRPPAQDPAELRPQQSAASQEGPDHGPRPEVSGPSPDAPATGSDRAAPATPGTLPQREGPADSRDEPSPSTKPPTGLPRGPHDAPSAAQGDRAEAGEDVLDDGPPGEAPSAGGMPARRRVLVLAVAFAVLAAVGTGFVLHAASRAADRDRPRAGGPAVAAGGVDLEPGAARRIGFVNSAPGPHRSAVATVTAADPGGPRTAAGLTCARFYAAAGTGVCLQTGLGVVSQTNRAVVLDRHLRTRHTFALAGTPSRARVSPSGRFVAWTVFVGGESYGAAFFSTRTSIVDTRTWRLLPNLEDFAITLNGQHYHAADDNFWGVTFARDDDTFYATLGTGGKTYLVRGSVSRRTVTTVGVQNVECPSLSPDGTRIAFKKRVLHGASLWHEYVLDLRTLRETPLAEHRSVDDQATWLDDHTLAYALPTPGDTGSTDLWTVPADGTGTPRLLLPDASSPAPL